MRTLALVLESLGLSSLYFRLRQSDSSYGMKAQLCTHCTSADPITTLVNNLDTQFSLQVEAVVQLYSFLIFSKTNWPVSAAHKSTMKRYDAPVAFCATTAQRILAS